MALAAGGATLQAQESASRQELSVAFQGLGLGSMPFKGAQSWNNQPGLSVGFGVGYTYWLNERIGLRTGLRMSNMSHNHQIKNFDMPFDAMLKLSSLGFPGGSGLSTVSMHSTASTLEEKQNYTYVELPLQAAMRFNRIFVNLGISLAKAVSATADYSYSDPVCEVTALPDLGITLGTPVSLTLNGANSGQVANADMVKPFFFLLDGEAGYNFPLSDATSIDVGLYGRLAPITHKTKKTADAYSIQTDATYQLLQPSASSLVEKIGYYEFGVSVGVNFGFGGQKGQSNGGETVIIPEASRESIAAEVAAMKAAREEAERELAAAKAARAKAESELASLEAARKEVQKDMDAYRKSLAEREALQNAVANTRQSEPQNVAPKQESTPVRTQGTAEKSMDKIIFYFDYNKTKPKYDGETESNLRALCGAMQSDANLKVAVIGHTDNVGTRRNNLVVGRKRAYAVKRLMVDMGAPADNISVATRGEENPQDSNQTKDGRAHNRRATIERQ